MNINFRMLTQITNSPPNPLSFKERGLGGELIDRLELINFIIMHNMYLLIQPQKDICKE